MELITLFEDDRLSYQALGLPLEHPRQQQVAALARQKGNWFELLTRLFAAR